MFTSFFKLFQYNSQSNQPHPIARVNEEKKVESISTSPKSDQVESFNHLNAAIKNQQYEDAMALVESGVEINPPPGISVDAPLVVALISYNGGNTSIEKIKNFIDYLLSKGANPTTSGHTLLKPGGSYYYLYLSTVDLAEKVIKMLSCSAKFDPRSKEIQEALTYFIQ